VQLIRARKAGAGKEDAKAASKAKKKAKKAAEKRRATLPFTFDEKLPPTDPALHHHMSHEVRPENTLELNEWIGDNDEDPALKVRVQGETGFLHYSYESYRFRALILSFAGTYFFA
jgi:hypothetical protein